MAGFLVRWPLESIGGWLALYWIFSCGLLAWNFRVDLKPRETGHWTFPTRDERFRRALAILHIIFLAPSTNPLIRILRLTAIVSFGLFLVVFAAQGIVINSPFRPMLRS